MTTGYGSEEPSEDGMIVAGNATYLKAAAQPYPLTRPERILKVPVHEQASFAPTDEDRLLHFRTSNHFELLFRSAIETAAIDLEDSPRILVVGAGTGADAVFLCLRLFRGAEIVATESSEANLRTLRGHIIASDIEGRVTTLKSDIEALRVEQGTFDLVVGVSFLHWMMDPDRGLAFAARAFKTGGYAMFMEPFEGYGPMRLAFERICAEADLRKTPLPSGVRIALQASTADIAARTAPDPKAPHFAGMDQKWLFSREAIALAARNVGFDESHFCSHHDHSSFYRDMAAVMLGSLNDQLPGWAADILSDFDRALPPSVKRLLVVEGSIILRRGSIAH